MFKNGSSGGTFCDTVHKNILLSLVDLITLKTWNMEATQLTVYALIQWYSPGIAVTSLKRLRSVLSVRNDVGIGNKCKLT